jgi:hypothetical protein
MAPTISTIVPTAQTMAILYRGEDESGRACCRETVRHEALVNQAFSGLPVVILCAYDAALAGAAVAELTHPVLIRDGIRCASNGYDAGRVFPDGYDDPFEPVPGGAEARGYGQDLRAVRAFASEHARSAGMAAERIRDLIIAVGESVANSYRYAGAAGCSRCGLPTRS